MDYEAYRFEEKVMPVTETGCYLWIAACTHDGYGLFRLGKQKNHKMIYAHRYAYEKEFGSIPQGMYLDHLCRVRCCVNPQHMEIVTCKENTRRGMLAIVAAQRQLNKTHCKRGHEYSGDNLLIDKKSRRGCKSCRRQLAKERRVNGL